jgi:L-rhamnose-H+ transport protein
MIPPSLPLGIGFHAAGAFLAANCYAPQKYVKGWAWEIFWMTQAAWCWLLWPVIGAIMTIPQLEAVLRDAPGDRMLFAFLMGIAYGIGGTAFNISIRYIGFALTYSIAVGLSSVLGTLVPPLVRGEIGSIAGRPGAAWVFSGVAAGAVGIGICGWAGLIKERHLEAAHARGDFSLSKGLTLSLVAGVLSGVYGMALEVAAPVADIAERYGAGIWKGNVSYLFVNTGAFLTSLAYSLFLARRHRTAHELVRLSKPHRRPQIASNYLLAFLTGTLWYGQFFFYNLGHVRLGARYAFSSWAIHMILLVLLSNLLALLFREWVGSGRRASLVMGLGIVVLCAAVIMLTYGNRLAEVF